MERQMIIRGVAVLCAGISASFFAVHQLSGTAAGSGGPAEAHLHSPPLQVMGASLVGATLHLTSEDTTPEDDAAPHRMIDTQDCTPSLDARLSVDALIAVVIDAPCHPDTRLVISHNDLAFSAFTQHDGSYSAYIPALSTLAQIDVFLSDDVFLKTILDVPEAADHLRVAIQWNGQAPFALHAYHAGAGYGDLGHVHAAKPFDPQQEDAFLISLGENRGPDPMVAEIYSVPVSVSSQSRVEVELQFREADCGQDFSAFLSDTRNTKSATLKELTFAAPECPTDAGMLVMAVDFAPDDADATGLPSGPGENPQD
jgi:hypothetical protein